MKKILLNESEKKAIIADREKAIIESFAKTFNSIKRIDENELGGEEKYQGNGAGLINHIEVFYDNDGNILRSGVINLSEPTESNNGNRKVFPIPTNDKGERLRALYKVGNYADGNGIDENEINGNINTLGKILQNKGTLDHLKNNDRIRLKLIDGEFLKKNPEWKDRSLNFLFYDARSRMVGVELIGTGKSDNAYPEELVIDLGQTNINEFEEENPLYSRQQELGMNPEIEPEEFNQEDDFGISYKFYYDGIVNDDKIVFNTIQEIKDVYRGNGIGFSQDGELIITFPKPLTDTELQEIKIKYNSTLGRIN